MPKSRRILVALDASTPRLAVLEEAAELASSLRAELRGLVVEDIRLLRLAGLPFAREIAACSATMRDLDLAVMERMLRSRAEQVRGALAAAAERLRVRWSFEVARGSMTSASLEAAQDADMLIIGKERPGLHPLLPRTARHVGSPLVVAYDGRPAAERSLEIAAELTPARSDRVAVVIVAEDPAAARQVRQKCNAWMSTHGWPGAACARSAASAEALAQVTTQLEGRLLMVGSDSPLLVPPRIEQLLELLDCPLAMVH